MFLSLGALAANLGVFGDVVIHLWRRKRWYLIPAVFVLYLLLWPFKAIEWLAGLPHDLLALASRIRQEQLRRQIEVEGREIYPLW